MSIEDNWRGSALDGVPYAGKTTTLNHMVNILPQSEIVVVPEYSRIGKLPKFPPTDWCDVQKAIGEIIDLEKRRTEYINNSLAKNSDAIVMFDRGPVSCIVFQYVASTKDHLGDPIGMAEAFAKEFSDGELILPLGYVHLILPYREIETRETALLALGHRKNIEFLRQPDVTQKFIDSFENFLCYLPPTFAISISTQDKLPQDVAQQVLRHVKEQPRHVVIAPDFIKFAEGLLDKKEI